MKYYLTASSPLLQFPVDAKGTHSPTHSLSAGCLLFHPHLSRSMACSCTATSLRLTCCLHDVTPTLHRHRSVTAPTTRRTIARCACCATATGRSSSGRRSSSATSSRSSTPPSFPPTSSSSRPGTAPARQYPAQYRCHVRSSDRDVYITYMLVFLFEHVVHMYIGLTEC